ncbi:hypothetical protein MGG_18094 [Pyricularia oryzae 70-15]|uniref:Uncharacterized protein n=1 Tax=Pyricularia oryzae (strain 70-15 / ATCC MYA-4617 / FGSC 8958) TaxID=242507 RepID=G4NLG3_PYRO7|nr:uncharacterized protein MGG_18094 [Pyricularia oryzae 70-15]EHA46764.1 hypothetical protein MGG_18094 [Pyricularia oryzae 70-15]
MYSFEMSIPVTEEISYENDRELDPNKRAVPITSKSANCLGLYHGRHPRGKLISRTDKESIARKEAYALYNQEIDEVY